ncbi:hypothetical protein FNJ87_07390 [Nonlabens mediterrranea]|uniref:Lacal_2735 family protein n=1 Tax=Nonlabens mediterrranea TaxID=1419947 RepID=A0ABS0A422_9FLAO|nr:hypothetical protein [Nonlabens mediterrranea]MBF4984156.1 hypothetical protein [Nonlabens mediterrranea]
MSDQTLDLYKKERLYCSMIRKSFDIALKDRDRSQAILKKAEKLKAEIILLKKSLFS